MSGPVAVSTGSTEQATATSSSDEEEWWRQLAVRAGFAPVPARTAPPQRTQQAPCQESHADGEFKRRRRLERTDSDSQSESSFSDDSSSESGVDAAAATPDARAARDGDGVVVVAQHGGDVARLCRHLPPLPPHRARAGAGAAGVEPGAADGDAGGGGREARVGGRAAPRAGDAGARALGADQAQRPPARLHRPHRRRAARPLRRAGEAHRLVRLGAAGRREQASHGVAHRQKTGANDGCDAGRPVRWVRGNLGRTSRLRVSAMGLLARKDKEEDDDLSKRHVHKVRQRNARSSREKQN